MKYKYETFEDWFDEIENYGTRSERFLSTLPNDIMLSDSMIQWLRAAFDCGREDDNENI